MCKNMKDFEALVTEILEMDEDIKKRQKKLEAKKDELKAYMRKRQKETLPSVTNEMVVSYKEEVQKRFDKEAFLKENSKSKYDKYCTETSCFKLKFLKPKKEKSA